MNYEEIEIHFHTPKERAGLPCNFGEILGKVDALVQNQPNDEYEIGYIDIHNDSIIICYFGLKINTQFDVEICQKSGLFYCIRIGTERFEPPVGGW